VFPSGECSNIRQFRDTKNTAWWPKSHLRFSLGKRLRTVRARPVAVYRSELTGIPCTGKFSFRLTVLDDDPRTHASTLKRDEGGLFLTSAYRRNIWPSHSRIERAGNKVDITAPHTTTSGNTETYWMIVQLEKCFAYDGTPKRTSFPFHFEGTTIPRFGPIGRLLQRCDTIIGDSITEPVRPQVVELARKYPDLCQ
jgi:hypothetical protein